MRIITWNCNMAFRNKAQFILQYKPDILIIQECEHLDKIMFKGDMPKPTDTYWYGHNQNKGLAVFSFDGLKIKLLDHNPEFKYILPLKIHNDNISWTLFAIWAQKPEHHDCYTEQIWNSVNYYSKVLKEVNIIIAGDFNSNAIWDKPKRIYNHTNLVELLNSKNIFSSYHHFHNQIQGKEKDSTLFMHRKLDRPYHIDYCFLSQNLIDKVKNVEIGAYDDWTKFSDHNPLIVNMDIN